MLRKGIAAHEENKLKDAEHLYRNILQAEPLHAVANYNLGLIAMSVNKVDTALPLFRIAVKANSKVERFWHSYIDALIKAEKCDNARQALVDAQLAGITGAKIRVFREQLSPALYPSSDEARQELCNQSQGHQDDLSPAIELREVGKYREAQEWLTNVIKHDSENPEALSLLSQVLLLDDKEREAEMKLKAAVSINSELPSIYRNQARLLLKNSKTVEALERAEIGCKQSPEDIESLLVLAACLGANQRDLEALQLIDQILDAKSNYAEAYATRALIRLRAKNISDAIEDTKMAVSLKPHLTQMWHLLSSLHHQTNNLDDAIEALRCANKNDPKNQAVLVQLGELLRLDNNGAEAITILKQATELAPEDSAAWTNLGVAFQQEKRTNDANVAYAKALSLNPHSATVLSNLGAMAKEANEWETALEYFLRALKLDPYLPETHSNLGVTLKELGRLDEAEASYKHAIALKPDYAQAHSNLGNALKELGRLDEAEASCRRSIALKPGFAEAHSNLGDTLKELGRLDDAEASYSQAIRLKPDYTHAHHNLLELLTGYISKTESPQLMVKVDREIKEIYLKDNISEVISNDEIIDLICKSLDSIQKNDLNTRTELSQTFRRNSVDLNCKRHMQIFNKFNVIPKFCFGCYKVQVEPRSVLELIKLFVIFDQIQLSDNNIRKCMIETRSDISGFYKGLIYCSSLEEATKIAGYLEGIVKQRIGSGLPLLVKRGCSEYPIAFPDYNKINQTGTQLMKYNEDWKLIEEDYDSKNSVKNKKRINPSLSCLSLSDILIIRNWIDYAKGIGDSSAKLLNQKAVISQNLYGIARTRLETYLWRESI